MAPTVNIIVSCTDRKRLSVPAGLRARAVAGMTLEKRFERWWERLSRDVDQRIPAHELYIGDHWQVCRSLPSVAAERGLQARLWIASAGYGLIPADAPLRPYSATFSMGQRDAVAKATEGRAGLQKWWSLLAGQRGPSRGEVRTIENLVRSAPRSYFLLVCSPTYVHAIADDLTKATRAMADPDRFIIVTSRPSLPTELQQNAVPSEGRLRHLVGGALPSLHARVARRILTGLRSSSLSADHLRKKYEALVRKTPELPRHNRLAMSDAQVRRYINSSLKHEPRLTHTRLLRELRDSGYACEQSRFRTLFETAVLHAA